LLRVNENYPSSNYTLRISDRMPSQTERVALIGHPIGIPWCINSGIVSRIMFSRGEWELIQTSIMISGGYSGGPLINANGEVLGLADAYLRGNQGISIFVSANRIKTFTNSLSN
jgi:serine protease Do